MEKEKHLLPWKKSGQGKVTMLPPTLPQTMATIQITTLHSTPAHMELMNSATWCDYEWSQFTFPMWSNPNPTLFFFF